jgi:hypothetical protein
MFPDIFAEVKPFQLKIRPKNDCSVMDIKKNLF